ncbi:MAG: hypothetical protein ACI8UG_001344 [Gammaproteobacteria bacterium]|jgi:hypothetical protein
MFAQLLSSTPKFDVMANSKQTFYWFANCLGIANKITVLHFTKDLKKYFITVSKNTQNITHISEFLDHVDECILNMHVNGDYN